MDGNNSDNDSSSSSSSKSYALQSDDELILSWIEDLEKRAISRAMLVAKQKDKKDTEKKIDGSYWTPLQDIYDTDETSFKGAFDAICGRIRDKTWNLEKPQSYKYIVEDLEKIAKDKKIKADDVSLQTSAKSDSSTNKGSIVSKKSEGTNSNGNSKKERDKVQNYAPKKTSKDTVTDFMGGPHSNKAHLCPKRSTHCAPRYGIISQAIIGFDLEAILREQMRGVTIKEEIEQLEKKFIKLLQLSVISPNKPKGIACLPLNLLSVPMAGQEKHFDNGCRWFFIPIMSLKEALGWKESEEYKVMVIAGEMNGDGSCISANMYTSLLRASALDSDNHSLLQEDEVRKATDLLTAFVKGLADMVAGRKHGGEEGKEVFLTPKKMGRKEGYDDLLEKAQELIAAEESLTSKFTVKVPILSWKPKAKVVGVKLLKSMNKPDPLLLLLKSAINWMTQNRQRPLPTCGEKSQSDNDTSSEETDSDEDDDWDNNEYFTPSTPKVPEFIQFKASVVNSLNTSSSGGSAPEDEDTSQFE